MVSGTYYLTVGEASAITDSDGQIALPSTIVFNVDDARTTAEAAMITAGVSATARGEAVKAANLVTNNLMSVIPAAMGAGIANATSSADKQLVISSLIGAANGAASLTSTADRKITRINDTVGFTTLLGLIGDVLTTQAVAGKLSSTELTTAIATVNTALTAAGADSDQLAGLQSTFNTEIVSDIGAASFSSSTVAAEYSTAASTATNSSGSTSVSGEIITMTTNVEVVSGTSGDDSIYGADTTFQAADIIDGGSGTDTINVTNTATNTALPSPTVTNVENMVYRSTVGGANDNLDLANFESVTNLNLNNTGVVVDIASVALTDTLTITNGGAALDTTITYGGTLTGSSDTATVTLAGIDKTGQTDAADVEFSGAVESMTLNVTGVVSLADLVFDAGTTSLTINADAEITVNSTLTMAGVTTVTATGAGAVILNQTVGAAVTTINASGNSGGITATGVAATTSFTGGSGNDTFIGADGGHTISAGAGNDIITPGGVTTVAIDGGDGTDTLRLTSGSHLTSATAALISNFEVLRVVSSANGTDMSLEESLASVEVDFSAAADATITNADDGLTVTVIGDGNTRNLVVSIKDATDPGTANTATLVLDHATASTDIDISGIDFAGLETLTINSTGVASPSTAAGTSTNSAADVDGSTVLRTLNITGDADFTLTDIGANNTVLELVDASAFTARLTVSATNGGAAGGIQFKGGSAADSITGDAGADILIGNAGNDSLIGAAGADTITGGAGNDTITVVTTQSDDVIFSVAASNGIDTIAGFIGAGAGEQLNFQAEDAAGTFRGTANTEDVLVISALSGALGAGDNILLLTPATAGLRAADADALNALTFTALGGTAGDKVLVVYASSTTADARIAVATLDSTGDDFDNAVDVAVLSDVDTTAEIIALAAGDFIF
jgi:hypothetical protein